LRVQGTHFLINNCCCSLGSGFNEIYVDSVASSVSLNALMEVFLGKGFKCLIFFVKITSISWVIAVQIIFKNSTEVVFEVVILGQVGFSDNPWCAEPGKRL
jgi:hypothetical protein